MSLQSTKEISIDVSNHRYILIDAKQYDRNLRYILITLKDGNDFIPINRNTHFASVRYRKPDNNGVFNACEITDDGRILIELTEQMLAVAGYCYADVVIHKNVELVKDIGVNPDGTLTIEDLHNNEIISTMTFIVNIHEAAFDNEEVESSYEYNKLNDLIAKAESTYVGVMNSCNDSKVAAANSASAADNSAKAASESEEKASEHMDDAEEYKNIAISYAIGGTGTRDGEDTDNAKWYYNETSKSADSADESEAKALEYRNLAQSYAIGGTGIEGRENESVDNAKYYYEESSENAKVASNSKSVVEQINSSIVGSINTLASNGNVGSFIFMGDVTFEELTLLTDNEKAIGFVYKITDDFITDDTFEGSVGLSYTAGTNVYYTANGKWDCLGGAAPVVATVDEVMIALGIQNEEIEEIEEIV